MRGCPIFLRTHARLKGVALPGFPPSFRGYRLRSGSWGVVGAITRDSYSGECAHAQNWQFAETAYYGLRLSALWPPSAASGGKVASSTCIKCGNHIFELVEQEPINAAFRLNFVQCSSCGGVVGVLDHFNIAQLISEFAKKLGARANRIVSGNLTTDDAEGA